MNTTSLKKKSYAQIWLSKCNARMQLETYLFFIWPNQIPTKFWDFLMSIFIKLFQKKLIYQHPHPCGCWVQTTCLCIHGEGERGVLIQMPMWGYAAEMVQYCCTICGSGIKIGPTYRFQRHIITPLNIDQLSYQIQITLEIFLNLKRFKLWLPYCDSGWKQ